MANIKYTNKTFIIIIVILVLVISLISIIKIKPILTGFATVMFSIAKEISKETITTIANISKTVNATTNSDIILLTTSNVTGNISVAEYPKDPERDSDGFAEIGLRYITITADTTITEALYWSVIYIYYNDTEVSTAGIDESTLRMYFYNTTLETWQVEGNTGVNTTDNYVWANVTHFSTFGIGGSSIASLPSASGGGGGCIENWFCTDWNPCAKGTQTRNCTDSNKCGTIIHKPNETKSCIPEQLFDITFTLDDYLIQSPDELTAIVTFESFGTEPTPVSLTFTIVGEDGTVYGTDKEYITVTTEEVLRKKFKALSLKEGKYTLILQTLYNVDVYDEFRQEFEIGEERKGIGFWVGIVVIVGILIIGLWRGTKMKKRELKKISSLYKKKKGEGKNEV